jgi:ABC-type transport system substrate-binding protein
LATNGSRSRAWPSRESWPKTSNQLTLNLRKDAVIHDGKPVTSADMAFSIMATKANHPFQTMFGPVERVETPDPYSAIIRMSESHPAIVLTMSPALRPILPKRIYGDGKDLETHACNSADVVGSGPFKLVEFKVGQRIVLERFDKFFTGRALLGSRDLQHHYRCVQLVARLAARRLADGAVLLGFDRTAPA